MFSDRHHRIEFFFARVLLSLIFWDLLLPRLGLGSFAKQTRSTRLRRIAARYRALANELGGLLIKVGQFLSSRLDVLPEEITSELAELQDEVRAENFLDIRVIVQRELKGELNAIFAEFDPTPLAAASLGQVHRAHLRAPTNGIQNIVVKVQRPKIDQVVEVDLRALRTVVGWLNRYPPIRKRADLNALLSEFTQVITQELDYVAEGRNAETFAANFKDDATVRVPRVIWTHTTRRVLALEDVYGIKITDYYAITAAQVDRAEVAERLFKTYLKQFFEDGFFHADPHPGNLFVLPVRNGTWQLTFVDFGMAGHVTAHVREGLRELAIGIATRDPARMIKGYQALDVLLPGADLALLRKIEEKVFERFWGKTMGELRATGLEEVREFFKEFRGTILSMPFQAPQNLILLGRTAAILSGMCTGLNPRFNVWTAIAPYAERLLEEDEVLGWKFWAEELATFALALASLPIRTRTVLGKIERGELDVRTPQLAEQVNRLERTLRLLIGALVFAVLLFGGVQLHVAGHQTHALWFFIAAAGALGWVAWSWR